MDGWMDGWRIVTWLLLGINNLYFVFQTKGEPLVEEVWGRVNGLLKYQLALTEQQRVDKERFILLMDACQTVGDEEMMMRGPSGGGGNNNKASKYKAVSLLLSNLVSEG